MNATERSMLHDTMAEMVAEHFQNPTEEKRLVLLGMRIMAGMLGMPEGHSNFLWDEPGAHTESRWVRRTAVMTMLARRKRNH